MSEPVFSNRLNGPLLRIAAKEAPLAGKSLEDWLAAIVLDHIAQFWASQPPPPVPSDEDVLAFCKLLDQFPDNPPDPGDELPKGYISPLTTK